MTPRRITHVAIRHAGAVYALPRPSRHHNVIRFIVDNTPGLECVECDGPDDQGFLDDTGAYLNRAEAGVVAAAAGQLRNGRQIAFLTSEDLW